MSNITEQLADALRNIVDAAEGLAMRQIESDDDVIGAEIIQNDCHAAREALAAYDAHKAATPAGEVKSNRAWREECQQLRAVQEAAGEPFNEREVSTLLAALRYWQRHLPSNPELHDIATNGGEVEPLDEWEIDDLCERINH